MLGRFGQCSGQFLRLCRQEAEALATAANSGVEFGAVQSLYKKFRQSRSATDEQVANLL